MQVQLKQREIEESVKGYLVKQGINLTGKSVTVGFTAGRSDRGLTAEIDIEGDEATYIPNGPINRGTQFPPLHPVPPGGYVEGVAYAASAVSEQAAQGANPGDPEPVTVEADPAPAAKTTSLFG